jgi:phosphoglycolate phosphatase-like HAD superfamily hydrolase
MRHISEYKIYIFDCDGVLLDSNSLKISAMSKSLKQAGVNDFEVRLCLEYFTSNFGKSRYHHIDYFFDHILDEPHLKNIQKPKILEHFKYECNMLLNNVKKTAFIDSALEMLEGEKYVASGSEQTQLQRVLLEKFSDKTFLGVYGSPKPKKLIVDGILEGKVIADSVFIGDSLVDLDVALEVGIDFMGYTPYSNTPKLLKEKCLHHGYSFFDSWILNDE